MQARRTLSLQAGQKKAEGMQYNGNYIFRFNAEDLIRHSDTPPDFTGGTMQAQAAITLPKRTAALVGGTSNPDGRVIEHAGKLPGASCRSATHCIEMTASRQTVSRCTSQLPWSWKELTGAKQVAAMLKPPPLVT